VIGQIDFCKGLFKWGTRVENAALLMFGLEDKVRGLHTNGGGPVPNVDHVALWPHVDNTARNYHHIILRGTEGEILIEGDGPREGIPWVRLVRGGQASEISLEPYAAPQFQDAVHAAIVRDLIESIETGARHTLDAQSARATLEVIMAAYESSRRRALIPLPLQIAENPLFAMLDEKAEN
jgi:predicted dehydrogenase